VRGTLFSYYVELQHKFDPLKFYRIF